MIKKMQRRLTFVMLLFLVSVYIGFCTISYFSGERRMEQESALLFDRIEQPLPPSDGMQRVPGQVGVPYFTIHVDPDGLLLDAKRGQFDLTDEELADIAASVMAAPQDSGYLEEYSLRFFRRATPMGWQLMFADESVREETQRQQIRSNILLGLVLLPVFYLFSWGISALITRPVKRAWEQQTQFVADASHELKTPLTVILSNTDMILADCSEQQGELHRRADYIRQEAGRMRALVLELLNLARNDAAPAKRDDLSGVELSSAAETAALSFEAVAYENGLTMNLILEENIHIRGEQQQLDQLLHILLDNAVKYSLPGGEICVKLSSERGKWALLTVENPSETLTDEQLSKLFDRFYRVDEARSLQPGYGLGLSVARQIVERWGGRIRAEYHDGVTAFVVRLPIRK